MTRDEIEKLSDEELNVMVATEVMGLSPMSLDGDTNCPYCGNKMRPTIERAWCSVCHEWRYSPYMEYTSDIAAAMQVVYEMNAKGFWFLCGILSTYSYAIFSCVRSPYDFRAESGVNELPRAISIASLLAKMQP